MENAWKGEEKTEQVDVNRIEWLQLNLSIVDNKKKLKQIIEKINMILIYNF